MPQYRRWFVPGGTYFFTANLVRRDSRILIEHIDTLRAAYRNAATRQPFETAAICVLPNHLHCIWTLPDGDNDFPGRWRRIKTGFSRGLPGERGVWQRRYWEHVITDIDDLAAHIDYVHHNPVKHGLVESADDWPFSSWHRWKRSNRPSPTGATV